MGNFFETGRWTLKLMEWLSQVVRPQGHKNCSEAEFTQLRICLEGEGWGVGHILARFYKQNSHCPCPPTVSCLIPAPHEGHGHQGAQGYLCRCSGKFHHVAGQNFGLLCPPKVNIKYKDRVGRQQKGGFNSQPAERGTMQAHASKTAPCL